MDWDWQPSGARVTRRRVKHIVDKAEHEFTWCWSVLADLRFNIEKVGILELVEWQPRLAKALFALERCYHELKHQDKALVKRKASVKDAYLRSQLQKSRALRAILDRTIDIGRVLGDSFAWLFYQKEHKLMSDHQKRKHVPRMATGVGGMGEITYLENLPVVNDYLVIYHGTTTFLRLGDISMVDMRSFQVVAIGELKSHRLSPTEITINVNLVGEKLPRDLVPRAKAPRRRDRKPPSAVKLDQKQTERLRRQVSAIGAAFKQPAVNRFEGNHDLTVEWNIDKLADVAARANTTRAAYIKADRGLLLMALRLRKRTLWSTFAKAPKSSFLSKLDGLGKAPREIIDPALPNNSVTIGWLLYPPKERYSLMVGMRPIAWWSLPKDVLESLIFRRLAVMTLYNPAFLIKDLRDLGYAVQCDPDATLTVTKPFRGASLLLAGFDYYRLLIQRYLLPETAVLAMLANSLAAIEAKEFPMPATIALDFRFEFP